MFTRFRHLSAALIAGIGIACAASPVLWAQNPNATHEDNSGMNGSLSREDLEKLGGARKPQAGEGASPESAPGREKAMADSEELIKALQMSCHLSDAQLVVSGTRKPPAGGNEVQTRVYEVACAGGLGYLLETQGPDKPVAISCLAAEEARAADAANGKAPGFFCKLPENKDVFATVTSMIQTGTGAACEVRELRLFGRSESTQSDYSEIACKDGHGFLLRIPLPGSQAQTLVMSCADAAKRGIKCRMTDAGPVEAPVSLDTFKDALARNGVSCRIDQIRMIGQEDHRKRYVVEYRCADQPHAMVAFIPLEGNNNPYEAVDCADALARGVVCKFTASD